MVLPGTLSCRHMTCPMHAMRVRQLEADPPSIMLRMRNWVHHSSPPPKGATISDWGYVLSSTHSHNSLKYAVTVAARGSRLKLWDTALDIGAEGTRFTLSIFHALTTLLFGDRICPIRVRRLRRENYSWTIGQAPFLQAQMLSLIRSSHEYYVYPLTHHKPSGGYTTVW